MARWWSFLLLLAAFSQSIDAASLPRPTGFERIQHFVFILEPGPPFDTDFGAYPHVEGTADTCRPDAACPASEALSNYWAWARLYVVQDFFFSTPAPLADFLALTGSLDRAGISWKIYESVGLDSFLADCHRGALPAVSWVMPASAPGRPARMAQTTELVNAVMDSKHWYSSAIFLASDGAEAGDDHVPPAQGLGPRVPSLVIGPYCRADYHHADGPAANGPAQGDGADLFSTTAMGQGPADAAIIYERDGGRSRIPAYICEPDGTQPCASRPIDFSEGAATLSLHGTGIRHRSSLDNVKVRIGETSVPVVYAGPAEIYPWIDQVDITLPAKLAGSGTQLVYVTVDGRPANPVQVVFR